MLSLLLQRFDVNFALFQILFWRRIGRSNQIAVFLQMIVHLLHLCRSVQTTLMITQATQIQAHIQQHHLIVDYLCSFRLTAPYRPSSGMNPVESDSSARVLFDSLKYNNTIVTIEISIIPYSITNVMHAFDES